MSDTPKTDGLLTYLSTGVHPDQIPHSWVKPLVEHARAMERRADVSRQSAFEKIGSLYRPLRGTAGVIFSQSADVIPLGLHETMDVYMRSDNSDGSK